MNVSGRLHGSGLPRLSPASGCERGPGITDAKAEPAFGNERFPVAERERVAQKYDRVAKEREHKDILAKIMRCYLAQTTSGVRERADLSM